MDVEDALVEREPMGINFHGLEMRGLDEPTCLRSADAHINLSEYELHTELGIPFRVYVQKGKGTPIFTYHDIGTNHHSFMSFFTSPEMRIILEYFSVYHICAPGHHDTAGSLAVDILHKDEEDSLLPDGDNDGGVFTIYGKTQVNSVQYPTLDQLADMLDTVVDHFSLKYFIGFGMGAGSNVLARYTLKCPQRVLGLFLLNPTAATAGYFLWFKNKWTDLHHLQKGIITEGLVRQLENHWFGANKCENDSLSELYENHLRSLHPINMAGYIQSWMDRTDLGITRPPPEAAASSVKTIQVDCCLVTGDQSTDLCHALTDMNGRMDPSKTQYLIVPGCTGMLMEENPDKLAIDFLHFIRNMGLAINLTPEKLRLQAGKERSQSKASQEDHAIVTRVDTC